MPITKTKASTINISEIKNPAADISDQSLIDKVCQGDTNAYGSIMRRYNQRMFRIARSIIKNDADALDVVQEAHIKAYTNIKAFRGESQFSTWLSAITRNEALTHLRKIKQELLMTENESNVINIASGTDIPINTHPSAESCLESKELKHLINQKVDLLPADFRAVFILRAIEQLSVKETAEILDIKPETVKTRMFRAKRLLREQIQTSLAKAGMQVYEVGGVHCDMLVKKVLQRIQALS